MSDEKRVNSLINWCSNYTGNMTVYLLPYHCSKVEFDFTTCKLMQTSSEMERIESLCNASEVLWSAVFWFATVTGIIGNSLAMITITTLPASTATFYIGILALSDLTAIIVRMVIFFLHKHKILNPTFPYWQIFPLMFDFTASYSNWLLVLICIERFITIRYPLKRRYYFTKVKARLSAVVMGVLLFAMYNITAWNIGYTDIRMFTIRNMLYALIPLILILILITLIAISMRIIHKNRKSLQERSAFRNRDTALDEKQTSSTVSERTSFSKSQKGIKRRSALLTDIARVENTITIMMIVAAVCFTLLTIPSCVHLFMYKYATNLWNTPVARAKWHVFSKIASALTFLNLAINFLLYFLSAKKFRTQLWRVLKCQGKKKRELNKYTTVNCSVTEV